MELLNAYWRMDYIAADKSDQPGNGNPFTALPQATDDKSVLILHRGQTGYVVMNRYPYNPGHLLVLPYRQAPELEDLSGEERAEIMELIVLSKQALTAALKPDGFNVGFNFGKAAGAGIPCHLHAHIVPRWNGDTNFLPVIGQTRTLPQALEATWDALKPHFS